MRQPGLDVLLALLEPGTRGGVGGDVLMDRLREAGRPVRADRLLRTVLELEEAGHVSVGRDGTYAFSLTPAGEAAAYDLGPGAPVEVTVVMIDLVGFVAFTEEHGDEAGLRAALHLEEIAREELAGRAGRVVKQLGDGVLGSLPCRTDPVETLRAIAGRCRQIEERPWRVRAGARHGRPISHGGDLYGGDVNLAARLCAAAGPGQALLSGFAAAPDAVQLLEVRGLAAPVPVTRISIR